MRQTLEAVKLRLAATGRPVFVGRAPANTMPPFLVVDSLDERPRRVTYAEGCPETDFYLEVRATADSEGNSKVLAQQARVLLSPGYRTGRTQDQHRDVRHRFESCDGTYTDESVPVPGTTNQYPGYTVDRYVASTRPGTVA